MITIKKAGSFEWATWYRIFVDDIEEWSVRYSEDMTYKLIETGSQQLLWRGKYTTTPHHEQQPDDVMKILKRYKMDQL